MHQRRVVITGMGAVTPLGHSVAKLYESACAGANGVGPISHFDARAFPTQFAAEVRDFDLGRFLPDTGRWANCGLNTRFALAAAKQALEDAGLLNGGKVEDRKSTRLNSSHTVISYAVFCLKKKKKKHIQQHRKHTTKSQ